MFKTLIVGLLSIFLLSGCVTKYVYIQTPCPAIEVLDKVPSIDGAISNDCLCDEPLYELLDGASKLRQSETYYIKTLNEYNKEFTEPIDK